MLTGSSQTRAVASDVHLGHDGLVELVRGQPVPCFESPARAIEIRRALEGDAAFLIEAPTEHGPDPITAVHDLELLDLLEHVWLDALADGHDAGRPIFPDTFRLTAYAAGMDLEGLPSGRFNRLGAYCFDTATPIVAGTYAAARDAVDVALTALDLVLAGQPLAYALCRPPGHHAGRNLFGGYCYFNNAAIVAQRLVTLGAARVAIVDLDYHHGNGTQQVFWERGEVLYVSLHGDPRGAYPYFSGDSAETGAGRGEGATRNFPLPPGTDGAAYAATLTDALGVVADWGPDAPIVVSLGFDTYHTDPICDFALETSDYARLGAMVAGLGPPVVIVQEGGYSVDAIGANAVSFLEGARGGRA